MTYMYECFYSEMWPILKIELLIWISGISCCNYNMEMPPFINHLHFLDRGKFHKRNNSCLAPFDELYYRIRN